MSNNFIWLILAELFIICLIIIIRVIFEHHEKKKISKILNYFERHAKEKQDEEQFKMCLNIIKQNSNKN